MVPNIVTKPPRGRKVNKRFSNLRANVRFSSKSSPDHARASTSTTGVEMNTVVGKPGVNQSGRSGQIANQHGVEFSNDHGGTGKIFGGEGGLDAGSDAAKGGRAPIFLLVMQERMVYFCAIMFQAFGLSQALENHYILSSKKNPGIRRVIWGLAAAGLLGGFAYVSVGHVVEYKAAEVFTTFSESFIHDQTLPTVTICSLNPFKYSNDDTNGINAARAGTYEYIEDNGYGLEDNFVEAFIMPDLTLLSLEDITNRTTVFIDETYGRCFSLNIGDGFLSMPGSRFGLRMVLRTSPETYLSDTRGAGHAVAFSPPGVRPDMSSAATVAVGVSSSFALSKSVHNRQPHPFSHCACSTDDIEGRTDFRKAYRAECPVHPNPDTLRNDYSLNTCVQKCIQTKLIERCNCAAGYVKGASNNCFQDQYKCKNNDGNKACRTEDAPFYGCYMSNLLDASADCSDSSQCPEKCHVETFAYSLFTSSFPNKFNAHVLRSASSYCTGVYMNQLHHLTAYQKFIVQTNQTIKSDANMVPCTWVIYQVGSEASESTPYDPQNHAPGTTVGIEGCDNVTAEGLRGEIYESQYGEERASFRQKIGGDINVYIEALSKLVERMNFFDSVDGINSLYNRECGQVPMEWEAFLQEPNAEDGPNAVLSYVSQAVARDQQTLSEVMVFWDTLNVRLQDDVPSFKDLMSLISTLGGAIGFWGGLCVLALKIVECLLLLLLCPRRSRERFHNDDRSSRSVA